MTIGEALAAKAPSVVVRETLVRTRLRTPDDATFSRLHEALTGVGATISRVTDTFFAFFDENDVTGAPRRWSTSVMVERTPRGVLADLRVALDRRYGDTSQNAFGMTPTARTLIDIGAFADAGVVVSTIASAVTDASGIAELVRLLESPNRGLPVVAVSEPFAVDATALALRLAGAAHVVSVSDRASWMLSDALGKTFSVYGGAVRSYPPGWRRGDRRVSFVWLPRTIAFASSRGASFADRLVNETFRETTAAAEKPPHLVESAPEAPILENAAEEAVLADHAAAPEAPPAAGEPTAPLTTDASPLADAEHYALVQSLRSQLADARHEASAFENLGIEAQARNAELEQRERAFRGDNAAFATIFGHLDSDAQELVRRAAHALVGALELAEKLTRERSDRRWVTSETFAALNVDAEPQALPEAALPAYDDPDAFVAFVAQRYGGRIVVSSRARNGFKAAMYEDRARLLAVLDLLGDAGYDVLAGKPDARTRFEDGLQRLHLKAGRSVTDTGSGLVSGHQLRWTDGVTYTFFHVRDRGVTFQPRRMLAIYYFFVPETRVLVLADLPEHLDSANSHT